MNEKLKVLGLMSGSSCDGLDAALCDISLDQEGNIDCRLIDSFDFQFSDSLANDLKRIASKSVFEMKSIESNFSNFVAESVMKVKEVVGPENIDYVANHGHTVIHHPEDGFTLQIGNSSILANEIKIPVISDFRSKDIAAGGEGAPLAPLADKYILKDYDFYLNLGGIANVGFINGDKVIGFDICPCNQVLDQLAHTIDLQFDESGKIASGGELNSEFLDKTLANEYLTLPYPKSMDNSWVYNNYTKWVLESELSTDSKLRTFTEFIARAISQDIQNISQKENYDLTNKTIVCTGGGAYNTFLLSRIQSLVDEFDMKVVLPSDDIIKYKEAMLMSLMGFLRLHDKPNCIASVTGASTDVSGGVIYKP